MENVKEFSQRLADTISTDEYFNPKIAYGIKKGAEWQQNSAESMQSLTGFQHWLGTNYKTLPTDSGEMTKRARLYLEFLKLTDKVKKI